MAWTARRVFLAALGAIFAALSIFFVYYTARLIYINLAGVVSEKRGPRQGGMYIGAVAFPLAAIVFGWFSLRCFRLISGKTRPAPAP